MAQDNAIWGAAEVYGVQHVILPQHTRDYLIRMMEVHELRLTNGIGQHLLRAWPTSS
jgi:hypothetical protein